MALCHPPPFVSVACIPVSLNALERLCSCRPTITCTHAFRRFISAYVVVLFCQDTNSEDDTYRTGQSKSVHQMFLEDRADLPIPANDGVSKIPSQEYNLL